MFIVAPIGRTKLDTSFSTFKWFCTLSIVTGSVAALELVEKATSCAGRIAFKKEIGFLPVSSLTIKRYIIIINNNPKRRVNEYIKRLFKRSALGASTINAANNPNTPYGANIIIRSIIFKTTSLKESKKSLIGLALFGGIRIIDIPNRIEKNITCSIFLLSDAAATKFDGTKSIKGCNGPEFLFSAAADLFFSASESYA